MSVIESASPTEVAHESSPARWLVVATLLLAAGVHLWLAAAGSHGWLLGAAMLAMTAVCVACAVSFVRAPSVRTARSALWMNVGMAVLHTGLMVGVPTGHRHGADAVATTGQADGLWLGSIAVELLAGLAAAAHVRIVEARRGAEAPPVNS